MIAMVVPMDVRIEELPPPILVEKQGDFEDLL
ncbi:MAG: hypothetical protein ACJAQ3_003732, partial [Planctomycetota bacterium]